MIKLLKIAWNWLDDRLGISVLLSPALHIAPQDAKWWYVFGSATLVAFMVQVASGVALAFSYISSSSQAYETLLFITSNAVIMIGGLWWEGQQSSWSPNFEALPLSEKVVGATSGPVFKGGQLFHDKACLNCHLIQGFGGRRGPDLTYIADKLTRDNLIIRIVNGGTNMPAFGPSLKPGELDDLVAFLESRKRPMPAGLETTHR